MKFYKTLQIGDYHINHCEDYLFSGEIGNDKIICAVMDGCTMATDSYFASTLVGKILRKITIEKSYKELYKIELFADVEKILYSILEDLFKELSIAKNQLMLNDKELLTTLIILVADKKTNKGIVMVIGDGLVCINGNLTEYDQDNKPDYLGFHINENFENWYNKQIQKIDFENIKDISIATDGIFMFKPTRKVEEETINPLDFLLIDKTLSENEEMLNIKLKKLDLTYGLKPTDDLAIIRIIQEIE